jgi:hypothetical protein
MPSRGPQPALPFRALLVSVLQPDARIPEASLLPCWMSWMPLRLLMWKNLPEFYENR